MKTRKEIERALIKKYRRYLWTKFVKAINEYELIQDGDRIAVAISGGKDSLILAKLFQELYAHGYRNFELEFIAMDPGYAPEVRDSHEKNLQYLGIPAHIYDADIFEIAGEIAKKNPCYMCARMRRGSLYAKAEELGCNKLALGHHLDDVIETILLNVLCAGSYKTMMPKLKADNFKNMELIRPLYLIREESIIAWTKYSGLRPLDCACEVTKKEEGSMRKKIKELIGELKEEDFTNVEMNIFRSAENVEIDRVISYKKEGKKHHFLDNYDCKIEE